VVRWIHDFRVKSSVIVSIYRLPAIVTSWYGPQKSMCTLPRGSVAFSEGTLLVVCVLFVVRYISQLSRCFRPFGASSNALSISYVFRSPGWPSRWYYSSEEVRLYTAHTTLSGAYAIRVYTIPFRIDVATVSPRRLRIAISPTNSQVMPRAVSCSIDSRLNPMLGTWITSTIGVIFPWIGTSTVPLPFT
jgi:hypothetical protein